MYKPGPVSRDICLDSSLLFTFIFLTYIFPRGKTECCQPVEVVSYKIGVCKVSSHGKECR